MVVVFLYEDISVGTAVAVENSDRNGDLFDEF